MSKSARVRTYVCGLGLAVPVPAGRSRGVQARERYPAKTALPADQRGHGRAKSQRLSLSQPTHPVQMFALSDPRPTTAAKSLGLRGGIALPPISIIIPPRGITYITMHRPGATTWAFVPGSHEGRTRETRQVECHIPIIMF